jgi:RimJ/RimL family protein N-acetyltransferase
MVGMSAVRDMEIEIASRSDIPAIMLIERTEGYQRFVGRWDAERHAAEIDNPSSRYYLVRQKADIAGFAILQYVGSANRSVRLKRIAVQNAGRGIGSSFLQGLLEICFSELDAHRIELFVFVDNERAYRTYLKNGFVAEGIARDMHRDPEGSFRSMRLMSLLKPDWKPLA